MEQLDIWQFILERVGLGNLGVIVAIIIATVRVTKAHTAILTALNLNKSEIAELKEKTEAHEKKDEERHNEFYSRLRRHGESIAKIKGVLRINGDYDEAQA